ncbi:HEPN domain-containing protein [Methanopyrus kandleri]
MGSYEEARSLWERAGEALELARISLEEGMYRWTAFHAEQAVQLGIKATLAFLTGEYPKVHELSELLGVLADVTGDRRVRELAGELRDELKMLSDAYTAARYRVEFPYDSEEDARRFVETAERVLSTLGEVLREHGFEV